MANPCIEILRAAFSEEALSVFAISRQTLAPNQKLARSGLRSCLYFFESGEAIIDDGATALEAGADQIAHTRMGGNSVFTARDCECSFIAISYVWGQVTRPEALLAFDATWVYSPSDGSALVKRAADLEQLGESPDLESRLNQIIGATSFIKGLFCNSDGVDAPEGLRRARAYIETHYAEPLTLDRLGSIAGLSPKRFSERFNQAFGMRPLAYLISCRMKHANELLATDMLIKDIAKTVGYEDQFYFSRIYKKYCGQSPEAARRLASEQHV